MNPKRSHEKIAFLVMACLSLQMMAQEQGYVPSKLTPRDSLHGKQAKLVIYGRVIENTSFVHHKENYIRHKIKIYNTLKDLISLNDSLG